MMLWWLFILPITLQMIDPLALLLAINLSIIFAVPLLGDNPGR